MLEQIFERFADSGNKKKPKPVGSPPPGTRLYVVGDIHGHLDHLTDLHTLIGDDAYRARAARNVIVYLGDYIDRGPQSREIIDLLINHPLEGFETIPLMGNHETVMIDFLTQANKNIDWLNYGGDATLASYGVAIPSGKLDNAAITCLQKVLAQAVPETHRRFLDRLKHYHIEGDFLMVHAGVRPGLPIEAQSIDDLFWIREPFLNSKASFGKIIIHGHTITPQPDIRANRIGIDTGAYRQGVLTSVVLQDGHFRFLQSKRR